MRTFPKSISFIFLFLLSSNSFAQQKRIYLANDDHTDYMWSGNESQYKTGFLNMLDGYMSQADTDQANGVAQDLATKFNTDGSMWMWVYEHNKTSSQFDNLMNHVRNGSITMPLNTLILTYGGMPAEAVLRNMYYAGRLERRYNLKFPMVVPQENQTMPGGIVSLWAGSGARYGWKGVCGCATQIYTTGNRGREIYHLVGPDGANILFKWNSKMLGGSKCVGSYAEARQSDNPADAVSYLTSDSTFLSHWPYNISAAFGYGWDDLSSDPNVVTPKFKSAVGLSDSSRRVILSNELDFFQDFDVNYGTQIPTYSGAFGNEWELYQASMGEVEAEMKRNVEKLRPAEEFAAIVSQYNSNFMSGRAAARDLAFVSAGLFYEHNWTADGPIAKTDRATWERSMLSNFKSYVTTLYSDGSASLGGLVSQPSSVERHLVFNPLSWVRTDFVDISVTQTLPVHVVEVASGQEVPSQVIDSANKVVRILASNVPSVGYRVYEIRSGAGASFPSAASVSGASIDNGIYKVTLGSQGQISSIVDHGDSEKELVNGAIHQLGAGGGGTVAVYNTGPVSTTLRVVAGGTPSHETKITLYAGSDRIDVEGIITQNFGGTEEYLSTFNLSNITMRHEEVGMIAKVARLSAGGDYADANARTDYLSFGHFVDLSEGTRGVTISNWDSAFFKSGSSTHTTLDGSTPSIRAVVGMQVDGSGLGIVNQGGDTRFLNRYSFRSHKTYDQGSAMRFALQHQNPLIEIKVTGGTSSPLPPTSWSFLSISNPDVLLWSLKPAEEGISSGLIARVWNMKEGSASMSLTFPPLTIQSAKRTSHIETDISSATLSSGALTDSLNRQEMKTYRLFTSLNSTSPTDTTPPTNPTNLSASVVSSSQVNLSWTAATDDFGVVAYDVYRDNIFIGSSAITTYSDRGLSASTSYRYTVKARDAAGYISGPSNTVTATTSAPPPDTQAPTAPSGLKGLAVSSSRINLSWTASTDNVGVVAYDIYRNNSLVGSSATTGYSDQTGLSPATSYSYFVKARDAKGNLSDASNSINVSTLAIVAPGDNTPPSQPSNLSVSVISSSEIDLSWSAATDNVGVVAYEIYANGELAGTVDSATLFFASTGLIADTSYSFSVVALDASGNSTSSEITAPVSTLADTKLENTLSQNPSISITSSGCNVGGVEFFWFSLIFFFPWMLLKMLRIRSFVCKVLG